MHSLDTVLSHYHAAKDVEATIKEGWVCLNVYKWSREKLAK